MKTIPSLSVDAQVLIRRLEKVSVGEVATYTELGEIIKRDVKNGARYVLESARRVLQRENKIVFGTVHGTGIKRLTDDEIAQTGQMAIKAIHRKSRKAGKTVAAADYDKLSDAGKITYYTNLSILGAIKQATTSKVVEKIETRVTQSTEVLPLADTLDMFKR